MIEKSSEIKFDEMRETNETEQMEEIEGYAYCDTTKQQCLNDCWFLHNSVISDLH